MSISDDFKQFCDSVTITTEKRADISTRYKRITTTVADMQVTLKRYTNWLPDSMTQGGYKPRIQWGRYLNKDGLLPSFIGVDIPPVIPQEKQKNKFSLQIKYLYGGGGGD